LQRRGKSGVGDTLVSDTFLSLGSQRYSFPVGKRRHCIFARIKKWCSYGENGLQNPYESQSLLDCRYFEGSLDNLNLLAVKVWFSVFEIVFRKWSSSH
jgi:hypothetical protein